MNTALLKKLKDLNRSVAMDDYTPIDLSWFCAKGARVDDIPKINTTKAVDFGYMFIDCDTITSIPTLDTSNGMNFDSMFSNCKALTSIPALNTSNGTNFIHMFNNCKALTSIPTLDTSNGIILDRMFQNCTALTSIPALNTSNGTSFESMFYGCSSLKTIHGVDLNKATTIGGGFVANCTSLTSLRVYNVRASLQLISSGSEFDLKSLIHTLNELCTVASQQTLVLATANKTTLSSLYCKVIDNTSEKKPMVLCESTDDGAMTINEYVALKNWQIA